MLQDDNVQFQNKKPGVKVLKVKQHRNVVHKIRFNLPKLRLGAGVDVAVAPNNKPVLEVGAGVPPAENPVVPGVLVPPRENPVEIDVGAGAPKFKPPRVGCAADVATGACAPNKLVFGAVICAVLVKESPPVLEVGAPKPSPVDAVGVAPKFKPVEDTGAAPKFKPVEDTGVCPKFKPVDDTGVAPKPNPEADDVLVAPKFKPGV